MEQKLEELVESDIIEPVEGPIPTLSGPKSGQNLEKRAAHPVSYTHLTLPTIYSV